MCSAYNPSPTIRLCLQVRSTGNVNPLTRQPIKGRKFGGGIRFGEMERDSLLAHGAAYLVHDRLHSCSDYHVMDVCASCGSLLSPAQAKSGAQAQQTLHLSAGTDADGAPSSLCSMTCLLSIWQGPFLSHTVWAQDERIGTIISLSKPSTL